MSDVLAAAPEEPKHEVTALQVAQWMIETMGNKGWLYQESVVFQMKRKWGAAWVYTNKNGNPAISAAVLKEFRRLTEDTLVWDRGSKAWRKRRPSDKGRGVE